MHASKQALRQEKDYCGMSFPFFSFCLSNRREEASVEACERGGERESNRQNARSIDRYIMKGGCTYKKTGLK